MNIHISLASLVVLSSGQPIFVAMLLMSSAQNATHSHASRASNHDLGQSTMQTSKIKMMTLRANSVRAHTDRNLVFTDQRSIEIRSAGFLFEDSRPSELNELFAQARTLLTESVPCHRQRRAIFQPATTVT